jgi:GTPase SAR1 family protein
MLTPTIYIVDLLASNGKNVLLVGPAASGKTSILQSYLNKQKKYPTQQIITQINIKFHYQPFIDPLHIFAFAHGKLFNTGNYARTT